MKVNVKLLPQDKKVKEVDLTDNATGMELLTKLDLAPDAHILTRNGDPIPLDDSLKNGDELGIIKVVSGG